MYPSTIDIQKSKQLEKLIFGQSFFDKITETFFSLFFVFAWLFVAVLQFYFDFTREQPLGLSLTFLIFTISLTYLLFYSIRKMYTLKRINGISKSQNIALIKKIAEKNTWNMDYSNEEMMIINFSWKDTGTDWGKQMTILYDKTDILVNCISFALHSTPSPFHWFANKRKVNKLKTEFENRIKKTTAQQNL